MSKRHFRYSFFSILLILVSCAPKVAPPPVYKDTELTLDEVMKIAGRDIDALKAITDINIEAQDTPYSHINASVVIKKPDLVQMRAYQLGMLVGDIVIRNGNVYVLSGKVSSRFKEFIKGLYGTVLWWDDMGSGYMYKRGGEYIINKEDKEIHIDSATLLPVKQEIRMGGKDIYIMYDKPEKVGSHWYQSQMTVEIDDYRFTIKIEKLLINPPIGENDFKIRGEGY